MINREKVKKEILDLFILKKSMEVLIENIRTEIDKKARIIELKPNERVKIILKTKEIFNNETRK